jgi:hypothetical protein
MDTKNNTDTQERFAYVARHRFRPGAYAVCSAAPEHALEAAHTIEEWLAEGALIARVTRDEALRELAEYVAAQHAAPVSEASLPVFLRKQAD